MAHVMDYLTSLRSTAGAGLGAHPQTGEVASGFSVRVQSLVRTHKKCCTIPGAIVLGKNTF
jgi:hypothetical protein